MNPILRYKPSRPRGLTEQITTQISCTPQQRVSRRGTFALFSPSPLLFAQLSHDGRAVPLGLERPNAKPFARFCIKNFFSITFGFFFPSFSCDAFQLQPQRTELAGMPASSSSLSLRHRSAAQAQFSTQKNKICLPLQFAKLEFLF
jgi:hypothetical protein